MSFCYFSRNCRDFFLSAIASKKKPLKFFDDIKCLANEWEIIDSNGKCNKVFLFILCECMNVDNLDDTLTLNDLLYPFGLKNVRWRVWVRCVISFQSHLSSCIFNNKFSYLTCFCGAWENSLVNSQKSFTFVVHMQSLCFRCDVTVDHIWKSCEFEFTQVYRKLIVPTRGLMGCFIVWSFIAFDLRVCMDAKEW